MCYRSTTIGNIFTLTCGAGKALSRQGRSQGYEHVYAQR